MPTQVALKQLQDLSHEDSPSQIFLETKPNTELHIISCSDRTLIKLPFGNRFDILNGVIIIHEHSKKITPKF